MEKIGYVYLTTNLVNGKQYVGQHLHDGFDVKYKGSGNAITNAINKYGWDNFKCEVLCWCSTQTQLNEAEDNYIKLLGTMSPNGYNLKGGGSKGKNSTEARKNMSEGRKKYYKNGGLHPMKGKHQTEKTRKARSEYNKTHYKGDGNPFYNHKHTEKSRKQMSEAKKGRIPWNKGKKGCYSEEQLKKNKETNVEFRKEHPEYNKRHSEFMKNYYATHRPPNTKPVYQYTLSGEFVKKWESIKEATDYYNGGHITSVCKGERKSTKGFKWSLEPPTPLNNLS